MVFHKLFKEQMRKLGISCGYDFFEGRAKIKRKNINEILDVNKDIKLLSPIETVDYYAVLVANNTNKLEKAFK